MKVMTKKIALKIQIFDLHFDSPTHPSHSCLLAFRMGKLPLLQSVNLQLAPSHVDLQSFLFFCLPSRLAVLKQRFSSFT